MILRFRDLSVDEGVTISAHSAIVAEKASVWWGWWKKQGEKVPVEIFQAFASEAKKSGGLEIYLFDTGTLSLFKTTLIDIYWDAKGDFTATPDTAQTPPYYGTSTYLAWFRLGKIEKVEEGEAFLKNWSYVRVDEFFDTNRSIFSDFYDKQISSFLELKHPGTNHMVY
jgi:hypothetical protein